MIPITSDKLHKFLPCCDIKVALVYILLLGHTIVHT
uniref:Uncharacterized protein n=1 Tax=Arundo donax TaxID=35708 RepID=A0A0A9CFZ4_ARUDO